MDNMYKQGMAIPFIEYDTILNSNLILFNNSPNKV